jgi:hypothetical protein
MDGALRQNGEYGSNSMKNEGNNSHKSGSNVVMSMTIWQKQSSARFSSDRGRQSDFNDNPEKHEARIRFNRQRGSNQTATF